MKYSVVVPVYGCKNCIEELVHRLRDVMLDDFEIVLVDDRSPDEVWPVIKMLCQRFPEVKGVRMARNFGQHYAITCGLAHAKGKRIIVMDCDLQDVPEEIPKLINKYEDGYDIVFARREDRQDGFFKKLSSKVFYSVFAYLTETKQDKTIANFGIYSKAAIQAVLSMKASFMPLNMTAGNYLRLTFIQSNSSAFPCIMN
jgi:dolichol-phosphate mannosyltransferase